MSAGSPDVTLSTAGPEPGEVASRSSSAAVEDLLGSGGSVSKLIRMTEIRLRISFAQSNAVFETLPKLMREEQTNQIYATASFRTKTLQCTKSCGQSCDTSLGTGVGSDVSTLSGCARLSAAAAESPVQSGSIRCCFTRMHSPPSPPGREVTLLVIICHHWTPPKYIN